jgi:hypothetical protein
VPEEQPKEAKVDLHVTMLLNWFDELRRRLPPDPGLMGRNLMPYSISFS